MAYYLSVCKDAQAKDFLLISEQHIDGKLPEIKAQIYFDGPASKLENAKLELVSYAISKKEVEILLNLAQKRETKGFRSQGLFADGKVDKHNPFNIFSYPSVQELGDLLGALDIKSPSSKLYRTRTVDPDLEHILDNRHHIFWHQHLVLEKRKTVESSNWTDLEVKESNILNDFNLIRLILEDAR